MTTLTPRQRGILASGLLLVALAGLFPPWNLHYPPDRTRAAGMHFLFTPPAAWGAWQPRVDVGRLAIVWTVIAALTTLALVVPRWTRVQGSTAPAPPPRALPGTRPWV